MSKRYPGNIITPNPQIPANNYQDTPASGVWGMYEVADLIERGLWPTLGNLNPGKFIENIFSTYLYEGTGSTRTITNGINLSGEGGMVWIKNRDLSYAAMIYDTERGLPSLIYPSAASAADTTSGPATGTVTSFNSNGFSLGSEPSANGSGQSIVSWTFRKAPKFFTCITYSGTGTAQNISHDLGSVPGCIMVKRTDDTDNWNVYHRGVDASAPQDWYMQLNTTDGRIDNTARWNDTAPTSTQFTVGTAGTVNASGGTYVAYLFAHNDGDGDFGPTGDQDIIKCGSYTGNGSTTGPEVDLGFEPQWIMIKRSDSAGGWRMLDVMRGITDTGSREISAQDLAAESGAGNHRVYADGYQPLLTGAAYNASGGTYTYIAIRRGPMAVPTDATDVFAPVLGDGNTPGITTNFPVDLAILKENRTSSSAAMKIQSRLTGTNFLRTSGTNAESSDSSNTFDYMDGWYLTALTTNAISWAWRRAPNYFDVVAYTGNGTAGRTVSHNLGVAPEMMWVKRRNNVRDWAVYAASVGNDKKAALNDNAAFTSSSVWNEQTPTESVFYVNGSTDTNQSGDTYIAYLFASLDGVSKVGSYVGDGTNGRVIDCGFSTSARFILAKMATSTGRWDVFDTARGIVAGNDPRLSLNNNDAEESPADYVDTHSSGFIVNSPLNDNGVTWIFYAIA